MSRHRARIVVPAWQGSTRLVAARMKGGVSASSVSMRALMGLTCRETRHPGGQLLTVEPTSWAGVTSEVALAFKIDPLERCRGEQGLEPCGARRGGPLAQNGRVSLSRWGSSSAVARSLTSEASSSRTWISTRTRPCCWRRLALDSGDGLAPVITSPVSGISFRKSWCKATGIVLATSEIVRILRCSPDTNARRVGAWRGSCLRTTRGRQGKRCPVRKKSFRRPIDFRIVPGMQGAGVRSQHGKDVAVETVDDGAGCHEVRGCVEIGLEPAVPVKAWDPPADDRPGTFEGR